MANSHGIPLRCSDVQTKWTSKGINVILFLAKSECERLLCLTLLGFYHCRRVHQFLFHFCFYFEMLTSTRCWKRFEKPAYARCSLMFCFSPVSILKIPSFEVYLKTLGILRAFLLNPVLFSSCCSEQCSIVFSRNLYQRTPSQFLYNLAFTDSVLTLDLHSPRFGDKNLWSVAFADQDPHGRCIFAYLLASFNRDFFVAGIQCSQCWWNSRPYSR